MSDPNVAVVEKIPVDISCAKGINERDKPEQVDWTKYLLRADNVVLDESGGLIKRNGWRQLTSLDDTGVGFSNVYRLLPTDDGLAFLGQNFQLYQLNESTVNATKKTKIAEFSVERKYASGFSSAGSVSYIVGVYVTSLYRIVIHRASVSANREFAIVVQDLYSNNLVRRYRFNTGGNGAVMACIVDGQYLHVYKRDTAGAPPNVFVIDTLALPAGGNYTPTTTNLAAPNGSTPVACVAFPGYSASVFQSGTTTYLEYMDNTPASTGTATIVNHTATDADGDGAFLFVAGYNATPDYQVNVYNSGLALGRSVTDTTATTVATGACLRIAVDPVTGDIKLVSYVREQSVVAAVYWPLVEVWHLGSADTTFTAYGKCYNWLEACRPFYNAVTGETYVGLQKLMSGHSGASYSRDSIANCWSLVNISSPILTGTGYFRSTAVVDNYASVTDYNELERGYHTGNLSALMPAQAIAQAQSGYKVYLPVIEKASAGAYSHVVAELTARDPKHVSGATDVISGGVCGSYDGEQFAPFGYLDSPSVYLLNGGAGNVNTGIHSWIVVLEYRDRIGNLIRSRTSRPSTLTLGGNSTITVQIPPALVNEHSVNGNLNTTAAVYRTLAGGTEYFLVTRGVTSLTGPSTVTDNLADATISAQESMFRQPGFLTPEKDRYHALAGMHICRHKDRVFYCNGTNVYYSSFYVDGEQPWFNPGFYFPVPGGTGPITGLASMDGLLIVFKRDAVFVVDGDGPPENGGTGTEFSPPRRISGETGCVDPRTIVNTPDGVMFRSDRGFELLTRNLQVTFELGAFIQRTAEAYPYNGGACYDRGGARVLFSVGSTLTADGRLDPTAAGKILAYDVTARGWTTFSSAVVGYNSTQDVAFAKVAVSGTDTYRVMLAGSDSIYYESNANKTDYSNTYVGFDVETAWVKSESVQDRVQCAEFWILGKRLDNHDILADCYYDYLDATGYSRAFLIQDMASDVVQHKFMPDREKVLAIKFRVRDRSPANLAAVTTGKGCDIIGLTARVGKKGGGPKAVSKQAAP